MARKPAKRAEGRDDQPLPFEKALDRLEEIARRLEDEDDLPLEESLRLFEEGVSLSRVCAERLSEAEKKVEVLRRQSDQTLAAVPLEEDDGGAGG